MSNKSTRQSVELRRQRFWWLNHQVLPDPELPASAKLVLYRISEGFNDQQSDGRSWEGYKSIADAIGMSEPTVVAMVHRAEALGHIRVEWGQKGSGHSNQYWMIIKPQPAEWKPQPADMNQSIEPRHTFGVPLEDIPASAFGDPGPNGPPHGVAGKKKKKDRHRHAGAGNGGAAPPGYDNAVPHWQEFTFLRGTIWKRGHSKDGNPKRRQEEITAWIAALDRSASPDTILAGAKKWRDAYADQPYMMPQLADWLNASSWDTPPPKRKANGGSRRRSKGGARRSRGDGASVRDELHEKLAERMRRKEAMQ